MRQPTRKNLERRGHKNLLSSLNEKHKKHLPETRREVTTTGNKINEQSSSKDSLLFETKDRESMLFFQKRTSKSFFIYKKHAALNRPFSKILGRYIF